MECVGCVFLCARMEGDKKLAFAIMALALPFVPLPNQKLIFQKANQIN